jgi:hypothetical protein
MEQMILAFSILLGGIFAGLYLISYRRLLILLKNRYPEKWKDLGKPEFLGVDACNLGRFLQFLRNPGDMEDSELIQMKSQTKMFLIIGLMLIGGSLSYWCIRFLIFSLL